MDSAHNSRQEPEAPPALRRRTLMAGSVGAALAASLLPGIASSPARAAEAAARRFDPHDWDSVRAQFNLSNRYLHFSTFLLASHPAPVRAAINDLRDQLDADPPTMAEGFGDEDRSTRVRAVIARHLGGRPEEVALTDSTTMAIALLYGGLKLRPGQEILTSAQDFYVTTMALRLRNERDGTPVRTISLYDDPARVSADEIVGRIVRAIGPRTRVLALTWVNSNYGVKLPARQIADALAEINARRDEADKVLFCLDGVHGFGVEDVKISDLGCDFFASSVHKWLFGPRGTGFLWGRGDNLGLVRVTIPSFTRAGYYAWVDEHPPVGELGAIASPGGFHSFEHRWAVPSAFDFHNAIGASRIHHRTVSQASRLKAGLRELRGVRVVTPQTSALSAGIVSCLIDGIDPETAAQRLRADFGIIATATPYKDSHLRFGPSITTTPQQVEQVIKAVARLR
ncbi:pyoverdine biosynthesis protein PvdN [Microbispora rosea subsp. aerata]|nr:aminotransferase class V-fold PLP-dependent enzyme [Microbispora rosea]GGO10759.1 pyoverdine biosynthesis protein PvdN [Microbispora rosea subsp. aerata]GIH53656.1 pyoverdine biosynthesis protein PvdN [Microbispora rosea subsp. aerata]GLJ81649.1 pyoverdine biosynthesis protein PvdN [Microbispora rosea subsp. aerata]